MRRALRALLAVSLAAAPAAVVLAPAPAAAQVEDDLREGDKQFDLQNYKKAAAAYDAAIRKYPTQVPAVAYGKRAIVYIALKDLEGGLQFVENVALKQHPNAPEVLVQQAVLLRALGRKAEAIPVAEKVVAARPSEFLAQNILGEWYSGKDPRKAAVAYEAYLQHRPSDLEKDDVLPRARLGFAHLELGNVAYEEEDLKAARAHHQKAVEQFETLKRKHAREKHAVPNANNGLCAAYTALGRYDQAITICEQIDRKQVDANGSVYYNLARAYLGNRQWTRARAAATEYMKVKPKEGKGRVLIGDTYAGEQKWEEALREYQEAERLLRPNQAKLKVKAAIQMGLAYTRLNKPALAIEKLEKGRDARRTDPEIVLALGEAYLRVKEDGKALTVADQMIASKEFAEADEGRRAAIFVVSAKALYNQGKVKESRGRFEQAFALKKDDVKVRRGLVQTIQFQAYQAYKKQDYKATETLLDQAAQVDPGAPGIALNRAIVDLQQKQCESAQKHLDKIKAARGYALQYHRLMARAYTCLPKPNLAKAAEHYEKADAEVKKVQANLVQAEIYTEWAPLLLRGNNPNLDDIVSKLQDAVQFSSQAPEIHGAAKRNLAIALFKRGWASLRAGKSAEAASDFERATREPSLLKGVEPLAFEFSHALALLDRGDTSEAARIFRNLAAKGNQSSYLKAPYDKVGTTFFAAYANYRSGQPAQRQAAAKDFEKLQGQASGAFQAKLKDLLASSWEYVAYDAWRSGKNAEASKALASAAKGASGDLEKRIRHNRAVLEMSVKQVDLFESLGATPPEALVNLGILYDLAGKPKEAYEAWKKADARGVASARDLKKWIDAKRRIYGFN